MLPATAIHRLLAATVASAAILVAGNDAAADVAAARAASARVEAAVAGGDFAAAAQHLAGVDCGSDAACATLVNFSYGWLFESWAATDPARSPGMLARAVDYYRLAHRGSPGNLQVLANLALAARAAGDTQTAIEAARTAARLDPARAGEQELFVGDVATAAGDVETALAAYRRAVELAPGAPAAQQRLVELYRRLDRDDALFRHSHALRPDMPDLAVVGYGYTIGAAWQSDPALAERALVHWVASRADLGALTAAHLANLPAPADWQPASRRELAAALAADVAPGDDAIRWWLGAPERRDAMARLLRLRGSEASATRGTDAARRAIVFLSRAVEVAPEFDAYLYGDLSRSSNVRLDAAADLVALHHALKADPDMTSASGVSADELTHMTDILFSGKAGAYAVGQLAAIQRYHTVLGMIFHATGRLESDWADNATYQLEHALRTAERIARKDAAQYRPLPELTAMLADTYRRQGRAADAARTALDATMRYLETDDLVAAGKTFADAAGADAGRVEAVGRILAGRAAIARGDIKVAAAGPDAGVELGQELAWMLDDSVAALPAGFVAAQRFKTLADLAAVVDAAGAGETARRLNAQALDAYAGQPALLSPVDLRRLRSIDRSLALQPASAGGYDKAVLLNRLPVSRAGGEAAWAVPGAAGQGAVTLDARTVEAGRKLAAEQALSESIAIRNRQ